MRSPIVAATIVACLACADARDSASIVDSLAALDDAELIRISASELESVPVIPWSETLRLGDAAGANAYPFGQVSSVVAMDSGEIVVFDAGNSEVVLFDSTGNFIRKFGRAGNGPGEFADAAGGALAVAADTIFIMPIGSFHAFSRDGTHYYTAAVDSVRPNEPRRVANSLVNTTAGLMVARIESPRVVTADGESRTDTVRVQIRSATDGYFTRPGLTFPLATSYQFGGWYTHMLFSTLPAYAIARNGRVFYARGQNYIVEVVAPDGSIESRIVGDIPRPRVAKAEYEEQLQKLKEAIAGAPRPHSETPMPLPDPAKIPRAELRSLTGRIIVGDGDTILVERPDLSSLTRKPTDESIWDIIRVDHGIVGRFAMPGGWFTPNDFRGGKVYGILRRDTGEQVVVRYEGG
jgi:hypothetical protein